MVSIIPQLVKNPPAMQETWVRFPKGTGYPLQYPWASLQAQLVKNPTCNLFEDRGPIPGLGRSPGEGKGYPLQYSGLENSMDCTVHGLTKSQTRLSDDHFYFHTNLDLDYQKILCVVY